MLSVPFCLPVTLLVVVVVVLYSPNTNRYITDTCKTNNSIKHIWQVAREALVLSQLATYRCVFVYSSTVVIGE